MKRTKHGRPRQTRLEGLATAVLVALATGSPALGDPSLEGAAAGRSNLDYVESATIMVREVLVRHDDGPFVAHPLPQPREVRLVPPGNDVADLLVDLELSRGAYDEVRLEAVSGTVVLTGEAFVAEGRVFSTVLGNLHLPSAAQSGIKVSVAPPVEVVTRLSPELALVLDLEHTFVFNGPPAHQPGVKRVLIRPVFNAANASTLGRIALRTVKGNETGKCAAAATSLPGAHVTATDRSGTNPPATTVTDSAGRGWLRLPPGTYDVLIAAPGYDPVRIENRTVHVANETPLGDVILGRSATPAVFDQDRAILLAILMNIAYADGTRGIGDLNASVEGDPLPRSTSTYARGLRTQFADYLDPCWKFVSYHDVTEGLTSTQWYVARQVTTGDLVVGVAGTTDEWDFYTDLNAMKSDWTLSDGRVVMESVHMGMRNAYLRASSEIHASLDDAIAGYGPNPARARVYFTGHSLGGALATLAALDLADHLVETHSYDRDNVIMYSYGAPRVMTERLAPVFGTTVPNGFAVAGKDDLVPHVPSGETGPLPNEFTQIENLVVLSSNILDAEDDGDGRYKDLGETRVERSSGDRYRGCAIGGGQSVPGTDYGKKGHEGFQYIKRLENIVADGIPDIWLSLNDTNHLVLNWRGGVQGPCDWVALYDTDRGASAPADADSYVPLVDGREWTVRGEGYPNGVSTHTTLKNPAGPIDAQKDFWIGYVDGFDRLIKTVKYSGPRTAGQRSPGRPGVAKEEPVFAGASPNPAVEATTLRFVLPRAAEVRVVVCDVTGRLVRELLRGGREAGEHEERWDLQDAAGNRIHPGIYFVRLQAEGHVLSRPVVVKR